MALNVIRQRDRPPPSTALRRLSLRHVNSPKGHRLVYRYEMDKAAHEKLLATLQWPQGFVVLSGWDSDIYHDLLPGWSLVQKEVPAFGQRDAVTRMAGLVSHRES